jgi:channel protein (hemolysin III family)
LGWTLFGVIWGLAIAGVVLKAFYKTAHPILSTCLYLLMGWLLVIAVKPLYTSMPAKELLLLIAGGLSYTAGVAFFCNRFAGTLWPPDLAPICHHRHYMPLFLSTLACSLTINKFPS